MRLKRMIFFARIPFSELEKQGKSEQRQYFTLCWQAAVRGIYGLAAVRAAGQGTLGHRKLGRSHQELEIPI